MVQEQIAEGDVVVTRVECIGTQLGPFRGLPPSGRKATFTAIGIDRFDGEKVVERSAHFDIVDLMRQLGHEQLLVPQDESALTVRPAPTSSYGRPTSPTRSGNWTGSRAPGRWPAGRA